MFRDSIDNVKCRLKKKKCFYASRTELEVEVNEQLNKRALEFFADFKNGTDSADGVNGDRQRKKMNTL